MLINENTLLKQLITELQDKNQLQKDIIDMQKKNNIENITSTKYTKSYAETVSVLPKSKPTRVPKVIIKTKQPNQKGTIDLITQYLVKEESVQTKYLRQKNDSEYEINCMNLESVKTVEKVLNKKLENCDIKIEQQNKPKIKVTGINNATKMDKERMEKDINNRNFAHLDSTGQILHTYINNKNLTYTVLMEVTSEIYKHIRENKNRVFVGHQCCKAYDVINTVPCLNCGRFGHNKAKCRNKTICLKCCDIHKSGECPIKKLQCLNCNYNNKKYKTRLNTEHLTTDRINCTILRNKIKKYINSTDYPIEPVLPAWDETSALKIIISKQNSKHPNQQELQGLHANQDKPANLTIDIQEPIPTDTSDNYKTSNKSS